MKDRLHVIPLALALTALAGIAGARPQDQAPRPSLGQYNLGKGGVALDGRDPVAYFPEGGGKARRGDERLTATYRGVVYRFANEENRAAFVACPERYEPAYGGWCAWAMAAGEGDKVDVDPSSFLIEEGRLLLFYDGLFADTRKKWLRKGGEALHPTADANWSRISGEPAPRELSQFDLDAGLALQGHDPVAYVSQGAAVRGEATIACKHDGITYRFATEANKQAFLRDPARYEPRYGGWCAYAMAKGEKVGADPRVFLAADGRLLLFQSAAARDAWSEAPAALAEKADSGWAALQRR